MITKRGQWFLIAAAVWLGLTLSIPFSRVTHGQDLTTDLANFVRWVRQFKPSGIVCDSVAATCSCTSFTDAGVQNQWNLLTCTLPANTLLVNGDEIRILVEYEAAANTNAKEMQLYWNGGTCGGTDATACASGTSLWGSGITNASSGVSMTAAGRIKRTAANAQNTYGIMRASTANIGQNALTATVTDTATVPIVFGIRNTAASAASTQAPLPVMTIQLLPQ